MRARRLAFLVAVVLAVAPLAATAFPASAASGTGSPLRTWIAPYMTPHYAVTESEAIAQAQANALIFGKTGTYADYAAAMKAANPSLRLIAYMNGVFAQSTEGARYPASWYLRDSSGQQVKSVGFGNYLMNPTEPGWISERSQFCASLLATSGFDGCGLDMLGVAALGDAYLSSTPLNPATGQPWTTAEWLDATTNLAASLRSAVAPKLVFGNGIGNGQRYFATPASKQLLTGLDGAMAEAFLRTAPDAINAYPSVADWKQNVDMLVDAGTTGKTLIVITKTWTAGTAAQKLSWQRFALASFLLGTDGSARFDFSADQAGDPAASSPWYSAAIGAPMGPYFARSGVFMRNFVTGKVVVNPGATKVTVSLGGTYTSLGGRRMSWATLWPHTGQVFVK